MPATRRATIPSPPPVLVGGQEILLLVVVWVLINFAIRRRNPSIKTETVSLELKLVAINCVHVVGATFG